MGEVIKLEREQHCCAKCQIPMTSATAEGREDCLYCDRCLEAMIDGEEV
jgi:hypothetical protein